MVSSMNNINIWDDRAALESCWFDCESFPTAAYNYPSSDKDFIYLTGYRDEATRADWYENVLFFSCLSGCRAQLRAERWLYILVPAAAAALLAALLLVCCCCRGCPLAWWRRDPKQQAAKVAPSHTPAPNPFLVSSVADFDTGYGYGNPYRNSNPYKRRSTNDRKMQNMETTMLSLATLPRAPPAALYNPLDHGRSLAQSDNQSSSSRQTKSSRKSSRIKVARVN